MSSNLTSAEVFPITGNTRHNCFLRTVNMTGFLILQFTAKFWNAFVNEFVGMSVR